MSEQILRNKESRQDAIKEQKLEGRGMVYFKDKKTPVELIDSRASGIGIKMSKKSLDRLQLQINNKIELELPMPTGKYEKHTFIIKHITPTRLGYRVGLQYANKRNLSYGQRNIISSNRL